MYKVILFLLNHHIADDLIDVVRFWGLVHCCSLAVLFNYRCLFALGIDYFCWYIGLSHDQECGNGKFLWKRKLGAVKGYRFHFYFGHSYQTLTGKCGAIFFEKIYDEK